MSMYRSTRWHRPICWQVHGRALFCGYGPGPFPPVSDALLIDGPRSSRYPRGREACLYQAFESLRAGGRVYLDDCRRSAERQVLRNWLRAYRDEIRLLEVMEVGHRVAVLEKVANRSAPRWRALTWLDTCLQAALVVLLALVRREPIRDSARPA